MANAELEKQVSELSAELATLREVLDRTFRAVGLSAEWYQAFRNTREINATEIAASMNTAAPEPVSAIPTAEDWQNTSKELFGRPLMTLPEIQEMIQKDAATTAKG